MSDIYRDNYPTFTDKAAAYTLKPSDGGKYFTQTSATLTWTLPAIADIWDGWWVRIYNNGATSCTITAPSGLFSGLNNAAATTATASTASNIIGACAEVVYDKTLGKYELHQLGGTWVMS